MSNQLHGHLFTYYCVLGDHVVQETVYGCEPIERGVCKACSRKAMDRAFGDDPEIGQRIVRSVMAGERRQRKIA
jgi:hypothetical protein